MRQQQVPAKKAPAKLRVRSPDFENRAASVSVLRGDPASLAGSPLRRPPSRSARRWRSRGPELKGTIVEAFGMKAKTSPEVDTRHRAPPPWQPAEPASSRALREEPEMQIITLQVEKMDTLGELKNNIADQPGVPGRCGGMLPRP